MFSQQGFRACLLIAAIAAQLNEARKTSHKRKVDHELCQIPDEFRGEFVHMAGNSSHYSNIGQRNMKLYYDVDKSADCDSIVVQTGAQGQTEASILFRFERTGCYRCYVFIQRTTRILQGRYTTCITPEPNEERPTLESVCSQITPSTELVTFFRVFPSELVDCKQSMEGTYHFTQHFPQEDVTCDSSDNTIFACQQPYFQSVGFGYLIMKFGQCNGTPASGKYMQCMGTWEDEDGNQYTAVEDLTGETYESRFWCMLTRSPTREGVLSFSLSTKASCSSLENLFGSNRQLNLYPGLFSGYLEFFTEPSCNFPQDYHGSWTSGAENDVIHVNSSHITFERASGQNVHVAKVFSCLTVSDTRYLTAAVSFGKCGYDYVCWEIISDDRGVLQWRLGRPIPHQDVDFDGRLQGHRLQNAFPLACDTLTDAEQWNTSVAPSKRASH